MKHIYKVLLFIQYIYRSGTGKYRKKNSPADQTEKKNKEGLNTGNPYK